MSKAEDRYLGLFQDGKLRNCRRKDAFLLGYHQAEKDLELTWEDIVHIIETYDELEFSREFATVTFNDTCKEVLKRFKETLI